MKHAILVLALLLPSIAYAEEVQTLEQKCTSDAASSYRGDDNHKSYVFDVENKCEFRLRCELNIAIFNAFGIKKATSLSLSHHTHINPCHLA
jgi:hypothetical protein